MYIFIYYVINKHLSFDYIRRAIIISGIDHVQFNFKRMLNCICLCIFSL